MPSLVVKKIELFFKGFLYRFFCLVLNKGKNSNWPVKPVQVKSLLILRQDKLGDMVAIIPTIHAIKREFPHIQLEVMASAHNRILIDNDPTVKAVHIYRKNIFFDWPMIQRLRHRHFDIVYDPNCLDSVTGLLLSKIIGGRAIKAASRKQKLALFYDYCEPYLPNGEDHNIDNGFLIFNLFGVKPETIDPFLPVFIPADSRAKASIFYENLYSKAFFLIGVNISTGSFTRALPLNKYLSIIEAINKKYSSLRFIIFCTMDQRQEGIELLSTVTAKVAIVPEGLSLLDAAAILEKVNLLISPDTSLIHLARLMKIPVIGFYTAHKRNFSSWRPYRQEYGTVVSQDIDSVHDIQPEQVVAEFDWVLNIMKKTSSAAIPAARN
ncbi:MAG: hypothetical protein NTV06_05570 [candidate division Zixibacteria bacterium]|nr:hypothetical protein [candidate division Zixibacteria bacterium]